MAKRGAKGPTGITYKPNITRGLPVGSIVNVADNSGVYLGLIISVKGMKTRLRRLPAAAVGDVVKIAAKKTKPGLKGQIFDAVIIRQRKSYRRPDGTWIQFEDNAAVIVTPEGDVKGTEIRGPVAREAAERWPKIAGLATMII
ncbi:MAG: 50S ribosomal protein L14 [Thermoprotei archaeon]